MRVFRNSPGDVEPAAKSGRSSVVAIGNFDGVHLGHLALIDRCKERAGTDHSVVVITFEPLPQAFFRPEHAPARLTTVHQKLSCLKNAGVDQVWLMRFGRELASLTAQEFVEQALVSAMGARCIVIGEDFRFGRGRKGNAGSLREMGAEKGFTVETVAAVECQGERISSSTIRGKLAQGDFGTVARCLGRPFTMEGYVVQGAKLGRSLGYPTANMKVRARPCPLQGVFAVFARAVGGCWLPAVSNLGYRPAVGGREPLLEVHFFDFEKDLYGQRLEVQFVAKLRDELDFESMDELVDQMKRDEAEARTRLAQAKKPL